MRRNSEPILRQIPRASPPNSNAHSPGNSEQSNQLEGMKLFSRPSPTLFTSQDMVEFPGKPNSLQSPSLEPFVDATMAAEFLSLRPRRILELARKGDIPSHPLGNGRRRVWRFRLSELAHSMAKKTVASSVDPRYGSSHEAVLGSK
jgi:hypothetical protein